MSTDPDNLPQWKGRPVPWIARWSNEIIREPYKIARTRSGVTFAYHDGKENRDERGFLWQREGISRGGEPKFAQVNTYRQRSAMRKCRCQVCGKKITEKPIRWLLPLTGLDYVDDKPITISAPTCSDCIPLALELCPHLKTEGYQIVKVLDYSIWGVFGETFIGERRVQAHLGFDQDYGEKFNWGLVFAKQQIVQFNLYSVEEVHENGQ